MSKTTHVLVTTVLALGLVAVASEARADQPTVTIRLYDLGGAGPDVRTTAMRTASDIAGQAGVQLRWMDCNTADHPCGVVRRPDEFIVRLMPEPEGQTAPVAASPSVHGVRGSEDLQLGFAAVEPVSGAGVLATIYYDRVRRVARRGDTGQLLGRAIAHELGHLLLRARSHSASGLMRPVWADRELADDRPTDWLFSAEDSRRFEAAAR